MLKTPHPHRGSMDFNGGKKNDKYIMLGSSTCNEKNTAIKRERGAIWDMVVKESLSEDMASPTDWMFMSTLPPPPRP